MAKKQLTEAEQMLALQRVLDEEEHHEVFDLIKDGEYDFNNDRLNKALREEFEGDDEGVKGTASAGEEGKQQADDEGQGERSEDEEAARRLRAGLLKHIGSQIKPT